MALSDSGDAAYRTSQGLTHAGWSGSSYWGGNKASFAGAQTFDTMSYGTNGIGGPTAVAAAGEALAVSQTGRH